MGYSNYKKIKTVIKKFGLDARFTNIFPEIEPQPIGSWLAESLEIAKLMPLTNEKTKSERLVSPILLDIVSHFQTQITLFSGEDLDTETDNIIEKNTDFLFALHAPKNYIDAPIISLIKLKNENFGECAAQVYGAYLYNKAEGKEIPVLYGCATTGRDWQFFKLENGIFYVHNEEMTDLPQVLGTWHWILNFYITNFTS